MGTQNHGTLGQTVRKIASGLLAFIPAARTLTADPPPRVANLVQGRVEQIAADVLGIATDDRGRVELIVSSATRVWHERWVKHIPIEAGDRITAWALPRSHVEYVAEELWVNWFSVQGVVSDVRREGAALLFHLRNAQQIVRPIRIEAQTLVVLGDGSKSELAQGAITLSAGQMLQVVGRVLKDGVLLATDVQVLE